MTTVKELLENATPLPWGDPDDIHYGDFGWYIAGSPLGETADTERGRADASLAVLAVNRLPDYEAAVEALERLIAMFDGNVVGNALVMHSSDCMTEAEGLIDGTISCTCGADGPLADAETALARVRDDKALIG